MLDAFLIALNVAAFLGYGAIPLDVFFPEREILVGLLPPGVRACGLPDAAGMKYITGSMFAEKLCDGVR